MEKDGTLVHWCIMKLISYVHTPLAPGMHSLKFASPFMVTRKSYCILLHGPCNSCGDSYGRFCEQRTVLQSSPLLRRRLLTPVAVDSAENACRRQHRHLKQFKRLRLGGGLNRFQLLFEYLSSDIQENNCCRYGSPWSSGRQLLCATGKRSVSSSCHKDTAIDQSQDSLEDETRPALSVLLIGKIWPEHKSTAAGVRTWQLTQAFLKKGWRVSFCSPAAKGPYSCELEELGIATWQCPMNRGPDLERILRSTSPDICVFDRFTTEEAFSFRIRELQPAALRVLDTQDLHFLRKARMKCIQGGGSISDALQLVPDASSPDLLRELSSIHRSDLTLVCSRFELHLLTQLYQIPAHKIALASFYYPPPPAGLLKLLADKTLSSESATHVRPRHISKSQPEENAVAAPWGFAQRTHFVTIGSFKHPPNVDAVRWLAMEIWPKIRLHLPMAECHVYGSYPSHADLALDNPKGGFFVKGQLESLEAFRRYRVCVAPLRYGAGIKGKILDSWREGLPVCTTPIGAEGLEAGLASSGGAQASGRGLEEELRERGLHKVAKSMGAVGGGDGGKAGMVGRVQMEYLEDVGVGDMGAMGTCWGGLRSAVDGDQFVNDAVRLYSEQPLWEECQVKGLQLLTELFDQSTNEAALHKTLHHAYSGLNQSRSYDYFSGMLWHHSVRSTEYFSRWIELKESTLQQQQDGSPGNRADPIVNP